MTPTYTVTPLHRDSRARCANERPGVKHSHARYMVSGKQDRPLCEECKDNFVGCHKHVVEVTA